MLETMVLSTSEKLSEEAEKDRSSNCADKFSVGSGADVDCAEPKLVNLAEKLPCLLRKPSQEAHGVDKSGCCRRVEHLEGPLCAFKDQRLEGVNFHMAALPGANFDGAFVRNSTFEEAQLQGTCFAGAQLGGTNFSGADLRQADFHDANMQHADCWFAHMTCADLTGADFRGVRLQGAILQGADLCGTDFTGADLRGVNLGGVSNLEMATFDVLARTRQRPPSTSCFTFLGCLFQKDTLPKHRVTRRPGLLPDSPAQIFDMPTVREERCVRGRLGLAYRTTFADSVAAGAREMQLIQLRENLGRLAQPVCVWQWRTVLALWLSLCSIELKLRRGTVRNLLEDLLDDPSLRQAIGAMYQLRVTVSEFPPQGLVEIMKRAQQVLVTRIAKLTSAVDGEIKVFRNSRRCRRLIASDLACMVRLAPPISCPFLDTKIATWANRMLWDTEDPNMPMMERSSKDVVHFVA